MSPAVEERRLLTILFADLSGFTALSSALDPEEVGEVVSIGFEHLSNPIVEHGGTVLKYEGDLIIAMFGFPSTHEDDPERAIKAGLEMLNLVPQVNEALSRRLRRKTALGLHIGINTGTVFVGEIGSATKREHTIMGDPVNITARLKDIAQDGEVIVAEPVFRAARYLFEFEALPPVELKGIRGPVRIFKPRRLKEKPDPKRGIAGLHSPMVGREEEFDQLLTAVEKLGAGRGGVFFVLGNAGLGKSRLYAELLTHLSTSPAPVTLLFGRCFSYGENVPYLPFLHVLESLFDISEHDSMKSFKGKIVAKTKALCPGNWEELVPYLSYVFSVRGAEESEDKVKYLDAQGLKTQIMLSIKKLLATLAQDKPVLLVIDDYHWIDNESLDLIESIFGTADRPPVLLLALSRIEKDKPGYRTKENLRPRLGPDFREIVLKPLDDRATLLLVSNLLKIVGISEEFIRKILAQAEGNPFYAEEIIRSLIDSGVLVYKDGIWKLTAEVASVRIPDSVQALIATRLDRLEQETKSILQVASVIGRNFYERILERLCQIDNLMLSLQLATLEDFEYIVKSKQQPEPEYAFRHPLITEVIYNGLLKKRRKELHRKTGEIIEELYPDRLDELTEVLAYQYGNSDNLKKGVEWSLKAGRKAKAQFANEEAIRYFRQVIALADEGSTGAETARLEAHEALGDIYLIQGRHELGVEAYRKMFSHAGRDRVLQSKSKRKTAELYHRMNRMDDALRELAEAEQMLTLKTAPDIVEAVEVQIARCATNRSRAEFGEARRDGEKALALLEADAASNQPQIAEATRKRLRAAALRNLANAYYMSGDIVKGPELLKESLRLAEELGDKLSIARTNNSLGNFYSDAGRFDQAIEAYMTYYNTSKEVGYAAGVEAASSNLGILYLDLDQDAVAIKHLEEGLRVAEETNDRHGIGHTRFVLGAVYLARIEDYVKAEQYLMDAKTILEDGGNRITLADLYSKITDLRIAQKRQDEKETTEYAEKSLHLAEKAGAKGLLAYIHRVFGKLYAAQSRIPEAEGKLRQSINAYLELAQPKYAADTCLEYAKLLQDWDARGVRHEDSADVYFDRAAQLYGDLKLTARVKLVATSRRGTAPAF